MIDKMDEFVIPNWFYPLQVFKGNERWRREVVNTHIRLQKEVKILEMPSFPQGLLVFCLEICSSFLTFPVPNGKGLVIFETGLSIIKCDKKKKVSSMYTI